jgi:hypothetical protein
MYQNVNDIYSSSAVISGKENKSSKNKNSLKFLPLIFHYLTQYNLS